jgi:hypothetical protein
VRERLGSETKVTCARLATKTVSRKVLLEVGLSVSVTAPPHARLRPRATLPMNTVAPESRSRPPVWMAPPASKGDCVSVTTSKTAELSSHRSARGGADYGGKQLSLKCPT